MHLSGQLRGSDFYYGQVGDLQTMLNRQAECFAVIEFGCVDDYNKAIFNRLEAAGYKCCTVLISSLAFGCTFASSLAIHFGYKSGKTFNISVPALPPAKGTLQQALSGVPLDDQPYRFDFPIDWAPLLQDLKYGWSVADYRQFVDSFLPAHPGLDALRTPLSLPIRLRDNCFALHPVEGRLLSGSEYGAIIQSSHKIANWVCTQGVYFLRNDWASHPDFSLRYSQREQAWHTGRLSGPNWKINNLISWRPE